VNLQKIPWSNCPTVCLAALLFVLLQPANSLPEETGREPGPRLTLGFTSHRSTSGRFIVIGPDGGANMELSIWADDFAGRVEKLLGLTMPFENRTFDIIVSAGTNSGPGVVNGTQQLNNGQLTQKLFIEGYTNAIREDAEEVFCRLLLNGYIAERKPATGEKQPLSAPRWLADGIAQNLSPSARARSTKYVLEKWQNAQLATLAYFLDGVNDGPVDRPMAGILVTWLLTLPEKTGLFEKFFERLAGGGAITREWLVTCVPDCESIADLNEKWENWLLKQRLMVFRPGNASPEIVNQLQSELLLYRGEYGIPMKSNVFERITYNELIEESSSQWIPALVQSKSASLRFLAVGHGKEFGDVVESYCRFFTALAQNKSRKQLEKLLKTANEGLNAMQKKIADQQ
jgi:hypothetical protein